MTEHRKGGGERRATPDDGRLPRWLTILVVLVVVGLLIYSVVRLGVAGAPISIMLGGLLGAYAGLDQFIKARAGNGNGKPPDGDA